MTIWRPAQYPGDRLLALSGSVEIGAVFPPIGTETKWRWRLFIWGAVPDHRARSELGAKTALDAAWADWLRRADLTDRRPPA
jgi:hypothetical protein